MSAQSSTLLRVKNEIKQFIKERDWAKFHSPKNISMSIAIEAAELMEHFQWLTIKQSKEIFKSKENREAIEDEIADIAIYIFDLCNIANIDIEACILKKLKKTAIKYPAETVKGSARKYTYYKKHRHDKG